MGRFKSVMYPIWEGALRCSIIEKIYRKIVFRFYGDFFFWERSKFLFKDMVGVFPNLENPVLLRDKLMWLTRYHRLPLKTVCADKYRVRNYVSEKGLDFILIPLIKVYDRAEDINFEELPCRFILKCNHASGFNVVVEDKSKIDVKSLLDKLCLWMSTDYSNLFCEIHYKDIPRKIVCEELISETAPTEYQCWCINGVPESLLVCRKNRDGSYESASYSVSFHQLYDRIGEKSMADVFTRPASLERILVYARVLSQDFPFVRVDFYDVNGKVYFAEMTFTPNGNYLTKYKIEFHKRLGKELVLPNLLVK